MTFQSHSPTLTCSHSHRGVRLADVISVWHQRRALRSLDDAALEDLGLTRREAWAESRRAFWDLPQRFRG
ncbi:DUF1127 domain-containing protein [uncultured Roseovarius sp.]|uniref:DUF1127 domain-containing protein n=1 Tax=uncultured Roseovarius sp. TaxID=293344 RepID=UPI0026338F31|nr:DUF1127 domain-containing protein [uncultured Roseovarius sp.]